MIPSTATLASNTSAAGNTAPVFFPGGIAAFECVATSYGGAVVTLQRLGPDSATWDTVGSSTTVTENAFIQGLNLPAGCYRLMVYAAPTGLYATLSASMN